MVHDVRTHAHPHVLDVRRQDRAIRGPTRPSFPSCARAAPEHANYAARPRRTAPWMLVRPRRCPASARSTWSWYILCDAPPDISRHALPGPRPDSRDPRFFVRAVGGRNGSSRGVIETGRRWWSRSRTNVCHLDCTLIGIMLNSFVEFHRLR